MTSWPSIDTQPHQRYRKRTSTYTAYYKSIDTEVNRAQDGDYSIGSWADEHHHESFAVETETYAPGANNLRDSFTDEELLNMQKRDGTDQIRAEAAWERTRFSHPIDRAIRPSIDTLHQQSIDNINATSIDNRPIPKTTVSENDKLDDKYLIPDKFGIFSDPDGYAKAIDGRTQHVSRENIADILQTGNGVDNLFMHHRNNPEQKATKEFYDTAGLEHDLVATTIKACFTNNPRSVLEISDDFGAFWRYLEQAPEMTIELDHRSILERNNRSILTSVYRSTAKRAESPFGHSRLEAQVFTILQDYP
ncbi:hypothetical protein F2Q68_00025279 [Brassica cretica]|uniref:Uncharacterized protein n=1 Tax=Brassica cretica TaxID=69181 RepID=A0A8S9IGR5_BRACR|nr:hypothetical protein F2Q68_00025279 [Brassica cretica]